MRERREIIFWNGGCGRKDESEGVSYAYLVFRDVVVARGVDALVPVLDEVVEPRVGDQLRQLGSGQDVVQRREEQF